METFSQLHCPSDSGGCIFQHSYVHQSPERNDEKRALCQDQSVSTWSSSIDVYRINANVFTHFSQCTD